MVDSNVSTKSDMTIRFEIQVKVSVFGKGHICWPSDMDSGKVGTATTLKRTDCEKQHLKSPLYALAVVCSPQQPKKVADSPLRNMPTVGFSFFFNGMQNVADA